MRIRPVVLAQALVVAAAVAALAACGGSTSSATTTTATPTTTTPTAPSSTTTSTTTPASTTTSTAPGTAPPCTASELKVENDGSSGAAGSIFTTIGIVNQSAALCTLRGRPTVGLVGKRTDGTTGPIAVTIQTVGQGTVFTIAPATATVTLAPGALAAAGFVLLSSDVPVNGETTCPQASEAKIQLPGIAQVYTVPASFTVCGGPTLDVSAIVRADQLPSDGSGGGTGPSGTSGVAKPPTTGG